MGLSYQARNDWIIQTTFNLPWYNKLRPWYIFYIEGCFTGMLYCGTKKALFWYTACYERECEMRDIDSMTPVRCGCNFKSVIFELISRIQVLSISCKIGQYDKTSLMISLHWFKYWPATVMQQAITWRSVEQISWRHMVSIGQNQ